jgi:glycosyltransferase involved in cell wall biosynthesis
MSIATCRMTDKPIRVGFLIQNIGPSPSGVWTRLRDLVSALMAEPKIELFAAVTNDAERQLLGLATDRTFSTSPMSSARRVFSTSRIARAFVEEFDLDLLQVESMPIPHRATVPLSVSLHDLREFDIPAWQLRSLGELYRRVLLPRQARKVGAVLSLTAWMSHEIEHRLSIHNVHVVPPIAPKAVVPAGPSEQVARSANVDQPFVLTVGHLEPRKNIEVLIRASSGPEWPRGLGLVIAGADHGVSLGSARWLPLRQPQSPSWVLSQMLTNGGS